MCPIKLETTCREAKHRDAAILRNINLLQGASVPNLHFSSFLSEAQSEFEHLMEEVAWSYWLNFFMKIGVAGMK